jgi:hypothetical protein
VPREPPGLQVVLADQLPQPRDAQPSWKTIVAYIEFVGPARPLPVIYASLEAARRVAGSAQVHDRPIGSFPRVLQDHYAAIALGRAIAHELGHYLFASVSHDRRGLMRDRFSTTELLDQSLDRFQVLSVPPQLAERCGDLGSSSR